MPIRPENRDLYPPDWPQISAAIRSRDDNKCKFCGVANGALGGRNTAGIFYAAEPTGESSLGLTWPRAGDWSRCRDGHSHKIVRIVLTVAHLNHDPRDCRPENLAALCQRCHLRYDAKVKHQRRLARERQGKAIGELL